MLLLDKDTAGCTSTQVGICHKQVVDGLGASSSVNEDNTGPMDCRNFQEKFSSMTIQLLNEIQADWPKCVCAPASMQCVHACARACACLRARVHAHVCECVHIHLCVSPY